ncbi:hypothetical protein GYB57_12685 [bacterium]|nr:hypothetical protein [bacterium]
MKNKISILFLLIAVCCIGCKEDDESLSIDFGYDYAPLNVGDYFIYQIDSIYYDDFANRIDTFQFQLKEVIDSSYELLGGETGYRIERYQRSHSSQDWKIKNVWVAYKTVSQFVRIEENQSIVQLVFPIAEDLKWDINHKNNLDAVTAEITKIQSNFNNGVLSFDSTITVTLQDEENLIEKRFKAVNYSKEYGLVYGKFQDLRTEVNGKIVRGIDYTLYLIEKGKE